MTREEGTLPFALGEGQVNVLRRIGVAQRDVGGPAQQVGGGVLDCLGDVVEEEERHIMPLIEQLEAAVIHSKSLMAKLCY